MVQDDLVQFLPSDLDMAFQQTLVPGETTLVSLPGSMGEAFVLTGSRLAVIRDLGPNVGIKVFSYPLTKITDVKLGYSATGGMFVIETTEKAEDEKRTVYFASCDKAKFETAAERIKWLSAVVNANGNGRAVSPAVSSPAGSPGSSQMVCSSCGGGIGARDAFCPACGVQVREICAVCSGTMPIGAKYCPACGSEAKPAVLKCYACGESVNSSVMSYCPQCGTSLTPKCASCGASVVMGWPRCRYCGREIGSDVISGRQMQMYRQREIESRAKAAACVEEPAEEEVFEEKQSPAEEHNAKGAEFFEKDMIDEAIEEFRRAVTLDPGNYSYHCNLAAAYDEADQSDDARREYERTLELNPNETTALLYLGYLLNEQDDAERAAELWKRVIEVAPGTPEAEEAQQNLSAQGSI